MFFIASINRQIDRHAWVEENEDLTLTCDAKGYPAPIITWIKDNKVLKSESNILEITSSNHNQSGEYECWANNTHGVDLMMVEVVISSKYLNHYRCHHKLKGKCKGKQINS